MAEFSRFSRIAKLRERLFKGQNISQPAEQSTPSAFPLHLNLGIDFGTSFTKVCYRDAGSENSGIVAFGDSIETSVVPSLVHVDAAGALSIPHDGNTEGERYLKMRLADTDMTSPSDNPRRVKALSAWFLATVIHDAKQWILQHKALLAKGRSLHWSANVGVPVAYCDSPSLSVFHEVLAVAWQWSETGIPGTLEAVLEAYERTASPELVQDSACQVVAEIGAAVLSFVSSREAEEGVYSYLDIGGGTVDSVAFHFRRGAPIAFYAGKVETLGVEAIANTIMPEVDKDALASLASALPGMADALLRNADDFSAALVGNQLTDFDIERLIPKRKELQSQVSATIWEAKQKDGRDWLREEIQPVIRRLMSVDRLRVKKFCIFIGGGGASSKWYQNAVLDTHEERQHFNCGIPPYILGEVRRPKDLEMNGISEKDFHRFAIAYGLSIPYGERPEQTIQLPSEFAAVVRPKRSMAMTVDYSDSKDVYD